MCFHFVRAQRSVACDHNRIIEPRLVHHAIPNLPRLHRRSRNRPVISPIPLEIQSTTPILWSLRLSLPKRPSLCRIETLRRRLCRTYSGSACDPAQQRTKSKDPPNSPHTTRSILLVCNSHGLSFFRGHTILPPYNRPRQPTHSRSSSPTAGVSYLVRRTLTRSFDDDIVMQIVICHSHASKNRSFSSQIGPDQGIQRISSSPPRKGAHRDPSPTRNTRRSQAEARPRRREAFLRLAVVPTYSGKAHGISVSRGDCITPAQQYRSCRGRSRILLDAAPHLAGAGAVFSAAAWLIRGA
ncbi:hypothetical protein BJ875DRAFT_54463 [Amylocarpus encephaloides]|uniref:Uncharacterized protein n=1 Tax=Amylocarpus encephaloides TaxID=45428 RepID=A0A9P7YHM6_9HELO|nr:hypothetical protein BJ875DRAFT_54463 [Amylocarpus encephaloides]